MAKPKQKVAKTPKKRSTKYGKLAAVCSKELVGKKAALVRAEKALAKAQRTHTELLSEVARLDMLDRSLKALINGTEAPQNVRYVYSYPQWVWYGNPYWNGNTWTLSVGSPQQRRSRRRERELPRRPVHDHQRDQHVRRDQQCQHGHVPRDIRQHLGTKCQQPDVGLLQQPQWTEPHQQRSEQFRADQHCLVQPDLADGHDDASTGRTHD
jgi:hypothetical protein